MPLRLDEVKQWVNQVTGSNQFTLEPASSDASFRRYYRVQYDGKSQIVMDAPPSHEDCRPFVRIAKHFHQLGLNVPQILEEDLQNGFLLLNDLGSTPYLNVLNNDSVSRLYDDAIQALLKLHQSGQEHDLPDYGEAKLMQEMSLFHEWFLSKHLQISLNADDMQWLNQIYSQLAQSALQQPWVVVHRDYHSRNLMFLEQGNPGIIDFQDAVMGPVTYDLVSLYRDCYINWPQADVENWVNQYGTLLLQRNIIDGEAQKQMLEWFDKMGAQRHFKAIGIFARLNYRDGKPEYLNDIPRTLAYVRHVSQKYDSLQSLDQFIRHRIEPAMHKVGMQVYQL